MFDSFVEGLVPEALLSSLKKWESWWEEKIPDCRKSWVIWFRNVVEGFFALLLSGVISWLALAGFLYLGRMLWFLYIETPVGRTFVSHYGAIADPIFALSRLNPFSFSLSICTEALKACFLISAGCRFLSITRFFFMSRGLFVRVFFWGVMCAALTTYGLSGWLKLHWQGAFALGLIPSIILAGRCFEVASQILPEFFTILRLLKVANLKKLTGIIKEKNLSDPSKIPFRQERLNGVKAP